METLSRTDFRRMPCNTTSNHLRLSLEKQAALSSYRATLLQLVLEKKAQEQSTWSAITKGISGIPQGLYNWAKNDPGDFSLTAALTLIPGGWAARSALIARAALVAKGSRRALKISPLLSGLKSGLLGLAAKPLTEAYSLYQNYSSLNKGVTGLAKALGGIFGQQGLDFATKNPWATVAMGGTALAAGLATIPTLASGLDPDEGSGSDYQAAQPSIAYTSPNPSQPRGSASSPYSTNVYGGTHGYGSTST